MRLVSLLALLLIVSGCDVFSPSGVTKLPTSSIQVSGPDTLMIGESDYVLAVRVTNTTRKIVYVGGALGLYRVAEDGSLLTGHMAFDSIVRAQAVPPNLITQGETFEGGLSLPTRPAGNTYPNVTDWGSDGPVDGDYVVGMPIYRLGGSQDEFNGNPADLSLSEPFRLTFVDTSE